MANNNKPFVGAVDKTKIVTLKPGVTLKNGFTLKQVPLTPVEVKKIYPVKKRYLA